MIARKINYLGPLNTEDLKTMFEIVRKIEITGEIEKTADLGIELRLEGDPSMIKLIEHQIERHFKKRIQQKNVTPIPYQNYSGITVLH